MSLVIANIIGILTGVIFVALGAFVLMKPHVLFEINERYSRDVAKGLRAFLWKASFVKEPKTVKEFRARLGIPFGIMFVLFGLFLLVRCVLFLVTI